ncbi:MAG TPA: TrmH family RNA methyltransferase [Bradyrhizobium sp.]|nr:TrmH family RNA methyltransferase [Bradyrhizobium sp.]
MKPAALADSAHPAHPSQAGSGIRLLLWDIQSPINFGMLLRLAETYRVPVAAYGRDHTSSTTARDFACGALERAGLRLLPDISSLGAWQGNGRLIATTIEAGSESLLDFRFLPDDVIVLGNEYDGLPPELERSAHVRLTIPMADVWTPKPRSASPIDPTRVAPVSRDGSPNLNVAMAGGIICYAAHARALQDWANRLD